MRFPVRGNKAAPPAGQGKRAGATLFIHDTKQVRHPASTPVNRSRIVGRVVVPAAAGGTGRPADQPALPGPPAYPARPAQPVTASHRLHTPSPSISSAAMRVISLSGTRFIRALPPTMPSPATAHSASTAPRPTESGSS